MPDLRTTSEQLEYLTKGCVDVVTRDELERRLAKSIVDGRPLIVKVGFDPSSADIHLGHVVLMRKMRQFQECGHRVVFVVGDFTAMIGDPTGRSKTRPQLSPEQIRANAETYRRQAAKVLDDARTEFRYNSEWLEALGSVGLIRLAAKYNVARMLERRDFRQRFESGQSIAVHEFLYPLAQAYDSVALVADVELGGTDQLFNLNVGRDIMPEFGQAPQIVMTTPLLEGLDGVEKMSKSLGNYIGVAEAPGEMFGKLMSISDELMWKYWTLLGGLRAEWVEIAKAASRIGRVEATDPAGFGEALSRELTWDTERTHRILEHLAMEDGRSHGSFHESSDPRTSAHGSSSRDTNGPSERGAHDAADAWTRALTALSRLIHGSVTLDFRARSLKGALAKKIVSQFHGQEAADHADMEFRRIFSERRNPSTIETRLRPVTPEGYPLAKVITELGLAKSNSEARRLVRQGAVRINGDVIESEWHVLKADQPTAYLIRVGPHRFVEVKIE